MSWLKLFTGEGVETDTPSWTMVMASKSETELDVYARLLQVTAGVYAVWVH